MKQALLATVAAIALAGQATAAPLDRDLICTNMGQLGAEATNLRLDGYSQRQAAVALSIMIEQMYNDSYGTIADRQELADLYGKRAAWILQVVYTLPNPTPPSIVAEYFFYDCMETIYY